MCPARRAQSLLRGVRGNYMCQTRMTVEQIGSPIRRHWQQRATLIGLRLNKIGRQSDLPDNPATRGMIAKVAHMVRIIHERTELDCFIEAVRAEYYEAITARIVRGNVLWASSRRRSPPAAPIRRAMTGRSPRR